MLDIHKIRLNINNHDSATKKIPHNIQINNNKKEPTLRANVKYSAKQNFRRYKTKIEPKLHSQILINKEEDILDKIKQAFGVKKPNTNYQQVETAPSGSLQMLKKPLLFMMDIHDTIEENMI